MRVLYELADRTDCAARQILDNSIVVLLPIQNPDGREADMGSATFFFPPNADPIYHEIADEPVDWINNIYGASLASEFTRLGIPFFNRNFYDLFYMGYGDTVPATGFISGGDDLREEQR